MLKYLSLAVEISKPS